MLYQAAWAKTQALTRRRYEKLLQTFSGLEEAWQQVSEQTLFQAGFDAQSIRTILEKKNSVDPEVCLAELQRLSTSVISLSEVKYPPLLAQISDAPAFLYVCGNPEVLGKPALAIVGTRKMSAYGRQVTQEWTEYLARQGVVIVSGLALGVDSLAHEATLKVDGLTVAVLGSGIDQIAPRSNIRLAQEIAKSGALVSEFSPGVEASEYTFPKRNRIIAGLSMATLVIEAGARSGALITASLALDQNREVLALPGSIYSPYSKGTNELIAKGEAKLVTSPMDILSELGWQQSTSESKIDRSLALSGVEKIIYDLLQGLPQSSNDLVRQSALVSSAVFSTLTVLEMKGLAKNLGQGQWVRH